MTEPSPPPPGTVWTPDIPTADARVGDWCEAWVRCQKPSRSGVGTAGGLRNPGSVPRRGQIVEIRASVVVIETYGRKRFLTTRAEMMKAWGYRPATVAPNMANSPTTSSPP